MFKQSHIKPITVVVLLTIVTAAAISACGVPDKPLTVRNMANATVVPGSVVEIKPTDFVLIWLLFGSPTPTPTRPGTTPEAVALKPTATVTPIPSTPTFAVPATATPVRTATPTGAAGTPASDSSGGLTGDPAKGKILFNNQGLCYTCHNATNDAVLVGPSLKGIATRGSTRIAGVSAADYVRKTINKPDQVIIKGFTPGVMPRNFSTLLTKQQIEDLVAYLMTLK